jgi:lysozyme
MRSVDQDGVDFIEKAEGSREKTYLDQAGRLTGGTGHLLTDEEALTYPLGTLVPQEIRDNWLRSDLQVAEQRLVDRVGDSILLVLTGHQFDALVSFVFNVGAGTNWTIWKLLRARKFAEVPSQFLRFDLITDPHTGKHVVSKGLLARRTAEKTLWLSADVHTAVACAKACPLEQPSSYTRDVVITPPEPLSLPSNFLASGLTKTGSAVASIGTGAVAVQEQIAPHADLSPAFHKALVICAAIGMVCAIIGLAIHALQAKAAHE